jgi:regulatory protein
MKITAIKQQVKRPDRYSIYVDGKYMFSLGETDLLNSGIHSGVELDDAQLAEFQQTSSAGKLFDRVLNLLSYRMRSEWEIRDYLRRKSAAPSEIDQLVTRLSKLGYVNDQRFAESWVESRRYGKPISQRKLRAELAAKRIDSAIIDAVMKADSTAVDEQSILKQLVAKKRQRYPDDAKFMQYLARQGFRYDDIKSALRDEQDD